MSKKNNFLFVLALTFFTSCAQHKQIQEQKLTQKPNVLFIAIDDINDWVKPLGGNLQAITPTMDKFSDNAMVFENAVCAAPICGPSRSALLSGFLPSTSGIYGNAHNMIYSDLVKENATLPEYFTKNGYYALSNGKIFHKHGTEFGTDFGHWAFDEHARARRYEKDPVDKKQYTSSKSGIINGVRNSDFSDKGSKLSWGPTSDAFEETVDYKVADWASNQLQKDFDKPFFMAVGFIKPHLPWIVPQKFFDMYDVDKIVPPVVNENDLDDILMSNGEPEYEPSGEYNWIKKHGLEKEATRAYLANISYVDACLGIVMDALEKSGHADNTIVVILGDHGWHLGEKQRYLKNTTWLEAVKTPLLVKIPGMDKPLRSDKNVSLIDVYPTLVSLCGLPEKVNIDGHDFSELLINPNGEWEYPGITVSNSGTSVLKDEWHYTLSLKGTEELYNVEKDPMEWNNLISDSKYKDIVKALKKWVPQERVKSSKTRFKKQKNYVDADADPSIKPTRVLSKLK